MLEELLPPPLLSFGFVVIAVVVAEVVGGADEFVGLEMVLALPLLC